MQTLSKTLPAILCKCRKQRDTLKYWWGMVFLVDHQNQRANPHDITWYKNTKILNIAQTLSPETPWSRFLTQTNVCFCWNDTIYNSRSINDLVLYVVRIIYHPRTTNHNFKNYVPHYNLWSVFSILCLWEDMTTMTLIILFWKSIHYSENPLLLL